jgi:RNA polymerase-binding protein DksA
MLTTINLQTIKQTLEAQRSSLFAFIATKQNSINLRNLSNPDNADHALTSRNDNREFLLLNHIQGQLDDIDGALKRLEIGTYGICTECGDHIQPGRLEIMPTAALCVECQRIQDNK